FCKPYMTQYLQPLDCSIFGTLKHQLTEHLLSYKAEYLAEPSFDMAFEMVRDIWESLEPALIEGAFRSALGI
ncbi:hypothetical protein H4S07_001399, partial [Coemansia furcata]